MRKVSNPLTIIGFFAGIAEVSGTIVLPFVSHELQYIFIWYVMGFPILLVAIFFLTLNFNSCVLYAPSDFANESNYMKLTQKKVNEVDEKIEDIKQNNPAIARELEDLQLRLSLVLPEINQLKVDRNEVMNDIYNTILNSDGLTVKELATKYRMSKSAVHRYLMELMDKGLIIIPEKTTVDDLRLNKYIAKK